jgi:hypothetical protein
MKKLLPLLLIIIGVVTLVGCGIIGSNDGKHTDPIATQKNPILVDVNQFANISSTELISQLGEPSEISESSCNSVFEIPCVYFDYDTTTDLGEVSFALVNDRVVRFTSYNTFAYKDKDVVLEQFGITKGDSCVQIINTDTALRYRCPSNQVDDFWITLIEDNTVGFLQLTYDMEYYEEWYLPLASSEEIEYKSNSEQIMKTMLTSPKTARFPWYDWEYGKNLFYIAVSSYVDAQNAFGVETRNTFTFVY